jgi:hypothetical protein
MDKLTERMLFVAAGDNSVDQVLFNTPGTYSWVVPPGITSISISGGRGGQGGASAGGDGGAFGWINNIAVTPGETLTIIVGAGGISSVFVEGSPNVKGSLGGHTYLKRGSTNLFATDGSVAHALFAGGVGGPSGQYSGGGGGGAGGYAGVGGDGEGQTQNSGGKYGSGGAGAGGARNDGFYTAPNLGFGFGHPGGKGGGTGLQGQGANGVPGAGQVPSSTSIANGNPGAPGSATGGNEVGGGGPGGYQYVNTDNGARSPSNGGYGQDGGLRIMWPGTLRQFPSTRTLDE